MSELQKNRMVNWNYIFCNWTNFYCSSSGCLYFKQEKCQRDGSCDNKLDEVVDGRNIETKTYTYYDYRNR
ncbi:UNVERIFIED_CONTAM: hypothetical protein Cloal_4325 [Acetivibrio alkalicellulosi]